MRTTLATLLVALGLFVVVVASQQRGTRRVKDLRAVLDTAYDETGPADRDQLNLALASSGRLAERALSKTRAFDSVRRTLARSDWTLGPGEFVAVSAGIGVLGLLLGLLAGSPVLAVLLVPAGALLPFALVSRSVSKRRTAFEEQLPDVLDLLGASLEAGAGIAQALELVVAEAADPAASEFARVLTATRLGASLVEGLEEMAERLASKDLVYTVQAIAVQQRTGGKLAEVLAIVADFMRGRAELRREVSALTAEGRLSGYILGGLPFAIAAFIALTNPDYLKPLFTTGAGLLMLLVAGSLMVVAGLLMRRIVRIEV